MHLAFGSSDTISSQSLLCCSTFLLLGVGKDGTVRVLQQVQLDQQPVDDDTPSLLRGPFQLLVAELRVHLGRRSDGLGSNLVRLWEDQDLECHTAIVDFLGRLVLISLTGKIITK